MQWKTAGLYFALISLALALAACQSVRARFNASAHPLDPLSATEIESAVRILRANGKLAGDRRFPLIALHEPPKEQVLNFRPGRSFSREAFAVIYDRDANQTFEAVVDLKAQSVISWKQIPGVQPSLMPDDVRRAEEAVRGDPQWREALRKRGIDNVNQIELEIWPAGAPVDAASERFRWVRIVAYRRQSKNIWAQPVEGLEADVNLNTGKVFRLVDNGAVPIPSGSGDYAAHLPLLGTMWARARALLPFSTDFVVHGREIIWRNWHFRFALHPREGVVLYTVGYEDHGRLRSILYRASLSEVITAYGNPSPNWNFRQVFDEGEVGIGSSTVSLEPGADVPSHATFFDAVLASSRGEPMERPRVISIFERDDRLLWRHTDYRSRTTDSRPARELVLFSSATIGNYDYGFSWIFHEDGVLEAEVLLTGIVQVQPSEAVSSNSSQYGRLVGNGILGVNHQHLFSYRLDMDVDGTRNSVVETSVEAGPENGANPSANGLVSKEVRLRTEKESERQTNESSGRGWKVINPSSKSAWGLPAGYTLVPGENTIPSGRPKAWMAERAGFAAAPLWVTQYDPAQLYAAGTYPNQNSTQEGLPVWIQADRGIENEDVVLWYTLGIAHVPRPEEWPVMPAHRAGFKLIPEGFFAENPAAGER